MSTNMEQYAQQFQMPTMDPETAAQYAQYYQDLYRQSEDMQGTCKILKAVQILAR